MKWDYRTVAVDIRIVGRVPDAAELDRALAPLGAAGWELVAVLPPCEVAPYFALYTFKRPSRSAAP